MGKYSGWLSTNNDKEVNSKIEAKDNRASTEHHLWNNSGSSYGRENHNHVVIEKNSEGRITYAHSAGEKDSRKDTDTTIDRIVSWFKK